MKVIFLEDVPRVGKAGETREVADGYGRNYLIPRKLAVISRPGLEKEIAARLASKIPSADEIQGMVERLEGKEITLKGRVGSRERLHGAVTSEAIAAQLEKETGLTIDKRKIHIDEPIHRLGTYTVTVKLAKDVAPKVRVNVIEEEKEATAEKTEEKAEKKEDVKVEKKGKKPEKKEEAEQTGA